MSEENAALKRIESAIRKVPADEPVWLNLYVNRPPEKIGALKRLQLDRDRDLVEQLHDHCAKTKRGNIGLKVNVRGPKGAEYEGGVIDLSLPDPEPPAPPPPAPPPEPLRERNPVPAVDPIEELRAMRQRQRDIREALEEDCEDCGEPESKCQCRCDDPPDGCGLPLNQCQCDEAEEKETIGSVVTDVLVSEKGRKLVEDLGDEIIGSFKDFRKKFLGGGATSTTAAPANVSGVVAKIVTRERPE